MQYRDIRHTSKVEKVGLLKEAQLGRQAAGRKCCNESNGDVIEREIFSGALVILGHFAYGPLIVKWWKCWHEKCNPCPSLIASRACIGTIIKDFTPKVDRLGTNPVP